MLIGYRFECIAQGDLHIHTRNRLMYGIAIRGWIKSSP